MPLFLFTDNARATLAAPIGPATTTITLSSGGGQHFPQPVTGAVFALTFNDNATGTVYETCYCTSRTGDTLVIQRGQEGSVAQSWTIGDFVFHGPTSGQQQNFVQYPHMTDASIAPVFSNTVVQGNEQVTGSLSVGAGTTSSNGLTAVGYDANGASWRAVTGSYGAFFRNDGANGYFLSTASGAPYGTWNTFRPFYWNLGSGAVNIDGTGAGVTFGGSTVTAGNSTVRTNSFFGNSGAFYAGPNGANSLLNFASNQYMQYVSGYGLQIVSNQRIDLDAPTTVNSSMVVTGNAQINSATYFGTSGVFYATMNGSNSLLNFYSNQWIQFVPGGGFVWNSGGYINLDATGGVNVSTTLNAAQNVSASGSVTAGVNVIATQNVIANATVTGVQITARGPSGGGQPGMNMGYDGQGQPYISFIAASHFLQQLGTNWWYWLNTGGQPTMALSEGGILNTYGYGSLSDERTKQDIAPFTRGLAEVLQLEPISYSHNGVGGTIRDGTMRYGLSAQRVREHLPEAVSEAPPAPMPEGKEALDDMLFVEDKPIMMAMINAIKELTARVAALEARL